MGQISDIINITVNVADARITRAGFGTPLLFDLIADTVFAARVKSYGSLADVAVDFANTTKIYQMAAAIFAQANTPTTIKVGRRDSGDADESAALTAIEAEDADWYCLLPAYNTKAILTAIATWISTRAKIMVCCNEDVDVLTAATDDVASTLKDATHHRSAYMWHHRGGVDVTGAGYTVTDEVATINETSHGLVVGDPVTFANSSGASIDGNRTVTVVVDDDNFKVDATGVADEAGPDTVDYFARYTFPHCAWAGLQLTTDPGSSTWALKRLTGIIPAPQSILNPSEEAAALGKNANVYTSIAGIGMVRNGMMASGRWLDVQRFIDWLEARTGEALVVRLANEPKIPYTDVGLGVIRGEIAGVMEQGIRLGGLGPLPTSNSGEFYRITIPRVADIDADDKANRIVSGITVDGQLAGAIHGVKITVNTAV